MKIICFDVRDHEIPYFNSYIESNPSIEIKLMKESLNNKNIDCLNGYEAINILAQSRLDINMINLINEKGIKKIITRTIGMDHIDIEYARKLNIHVMNTGYPPYGVAEHAIFLMLSALRKAKIVHRKMNSYDYTLTYVMAKELRNCTVGVIGTGKIGYEVIKLLNGFGAKVIAYDVFKRNEDNINYVSFEELIVKSDIITVHVPYMKDTYHLINEDTINKMKNGVILVNVARGELMDSHALIRGVESEKIGALGLDVIEEEKGTYKTNKRYAAYKNRELLYLNQFPNVIMTPHIAFFTESNVKEMVEQSIINLINMNN